MKKITIYLFSLCMSLLPKASYQPLSIPGSHKLYLLWDWTLVLNIVHALRASHCVEGSGCLSQYLGEPFEGCYSCYWWWWLTLETPWADGTTSSREACGCPSHCYLDSRKEQQPDSILPNQTDARYTRTNALLSSLLFHLASFIATGLSREHSLQK